jgi:GNAT superfamily N-acetyltransferase
MGDDGRVQVRAAGEQDDLDALNVGNSAWIGATLIRELFAAAAEAPHEMFVAELDGTPVGYADAVAAGIADGHRGMATVFVQPAARGQGVGSALWDRVLTVCSPDRIRGIKVDVDEDDDTSFQIAVSHGLQPGGVHIESTLDLTRVDTWPNPAGSGWLSEVELRSMPENATEQQWRELSAVHDVLAADTPDAASGTDPIPFEIFRTFMAEPWQAMCAWHHGELIGLTTVMVRDRESRRLNTFFTGVARDYRSRGLATALKIAHARALQADGWEQLTTQNMEGNVHILASNATLGFRRTSARRDMNFDHSPH